MADATDAMRISELSSRVGVSEHVLRAWERRYRLLEPARTPGGYRIYGPGDEARVRAVAALVADRVPASQAVARVLAAERGRPSSPADRPSGADGGVAPTRPGASGAIVREDFLAAIRAFDDMAAHAALDRMLGSRPIEEAIESDLMPTLVDIGQEWSDGRLTIAHEHFASQLIHRRLGAFTHTWGQGGGPIAVLACLPGEEHDIALLCLGVLLGRSGWRVRFFGANTPVAEVGAAADALRPAMVVLSCTRPETLKEQRRAITSLGARHPVSIGGRGAQTGRAPRHTQLLTGSVLETARSLTDAHAALARTRAPTRQARRQSTGSAP